MIAEFNSATGKRTSRTGPPSFAEGQPFRNRRNPALNTSIRLPVTAANRARLQALRKAEFHVWNQSPPTGANAALRAEVARAVQAGQREFRWTAGVAATAAVAVALGVLASIRFVEQHADFVAFVKQLLGPA